MLCIAICDDDVAIRSQLLLFLKNYEQEHGIEIRPILFSDGKALSEANLSSVDLLITDVQMPHRNGIEAAKLLREKYRRLPMVFISSFLEYALQGYEVQAFRFLLKPLTEEQLSGVLGQVLSELKSRRQEYLTIAENDTTHRVPISEITYVETDGGRLRVHCISSVVICRSAMQEVENTLKDYGFFRCHKAYLIALSEVKTVGLTDVILRDGSVIPVSKHRKRELKETLTIFWGEQLL